MPRRKELSPDRTLHIDVRLKGIPSGGSPLQYTSSRAVPIINGTAVPPLRDGWIQCLANHFWNGLSTGELQYLELVIANYVNERVIRTKPITWKELLSELHGISAAAKSLMDELNKRATNDAIWTRVLRQLPEDQRDDFMLSKVRSVVSVLSIANAALSRAKSEKAGGKGRTHKGPWIDLVNALADMFELKGGTATAAKNLCDGASAKPSSFVELVWTVMTCAVPDGLREHATASKNAMSNAISKVLIRRKAGKKRPTGPFREILDEINPVNKTEG
jgi:hypothetical protein